MERRLYYCEPWERKNFKIGSRDFIICISPPIYGNDNRTSTQIHGIILKSNSVLRIGMMKDGITMEEASVALASFEDNIRSTVRSIVSWEKDIFEDGVVKIWYYEEEQQTQRNSYEDKRQYPPMRFAITMINTNPIEDSVGIQLKVKLEEVVINWLGQFDR